MSIWYDIKKTDEIEVSEDGKTLDVLFMTNELGNTYVQIPINRIIDELEKTKNYKIQEIEVKDETK